MITTNREIVIYDFPFNKKNPNHLLKPVTIAAHAGLVKRLTIQSSQLETRHVQFNDLESEMCIDLILLRDGF